MATLFVRVTIAKQRIHCLTQLCVTQFCVIENPFEYGRELGTDALVDRQDELRAVISTIQRGGKLFLIGPRRFGKTSIRDAAAAQLSPQQSETLCLIAKNLPSDERSRNIA